MSNEMIRIPLRQPMLTLSQNYSDEIDYRPIQYIAVRRSEWEDPEGRASIERRRIAAEQLLAAPAETLRLQPSNSAQILNRAFEEWAGRIDAETLRNCFAPGILRDPTEVIPEEAPPDETWEQWLERPQKQAAKNREWNR